MYPLYSIAPKHPEFPASGTVVYANVTTSLESTAHIFPLSESNQNEYPLEQAIATLINPVMLESPTDALTEALGLRETDADTEEDGLTEEDGEPEAEADGLSDALGDTDTEADGLIDVEELGDVELEGEIDVEAEGLVLELGDIDAEGDTKDDNLTSLCWAFSIPGLLRPSIPTHSWKLESGPLKAVSANPVKFPFHIRGIGIVYINLPRYLRGELYLSYSLPVELSDT